VRDDSRVAALLYQQPVTTYQAYNDYPYDNTTGKSLYSFNSYGATTISGGKNAVKVSFDRPYLSDGSGIAWGQSFLSWEYAFVRWMEKSGYDVTYATDVDTHTNGSVLLNYRGILSGGHDEYWSKPMYDAFVAARDAGVNLAFLGANAIYWQVRLEPSSSGVPNRVLVCYRNANLDPITDPTLKTVNWRDPQLNRPEQTLAGVQFTNQTAWSSQTNGYYPYVVTNSGNWVYAGTGFKDGDSVPHLVGYEADRLFSQYPSPNAVNGTYTSLSNSPFNAAGGTDNSNASVYQAPSGAWVFATGTFGWSWALDNYNGNNIVDPRMQQTTANVLNAFLTGVAPTITSFTPASGPMGTSVTINGTNFIGATSVAFNGTAANFTVTSGTAIQATVPSGTTTGPLSVTTPGGTATSTNNFIVIPPPAITSFTPTSGPVGTVVAIGGANFTAATAVTFNGSAASFTLASDTAIQATVPVGATTGPLSVTTPGGTASSTNDFIVIPAPIITSFTPTNGRVGTSVTISGTSFTGATAVTFNGSAASFTVTSDTTIQATVPVGATTGPMSVTTPGGMALSPSNFTVRVPLTVTKTSLIVGGTVTSSPAGINCGSTCSVDFDRGTVVTLTAKPGFLSIFTGWNGCDTAKGTTCTVTMNAAKTVTANFLL
jgi:hypothetical protein